jgi:hypothetical protein
MRHRTALEEMVYERCQHSVTIKGRFAIRTGTHSPVWTNTVTSTVTSAYEAMNNLMKNLRLTGFQFPVTTASFGQGR